MLERPLQDNIDLIIYDFDGVMTDNRALVLEDGREAVFVNRGDGLAIAALRKLGIPQVIISTEQNPVVAARARKLKIRCIQGVDDKEEAVKKYLRKNEFTADRVVYVGNDTNDKAAMLLVGWPIAPKDAHPEIRSISKLVLRTKGGHGVVRELYDILKSAE